MDLKNPRTLLVAGGALLALLAGSAIGWRLVHGQDASRTPPAASEGGLVIDNTTSWKRTIVPRKHELSTEVRFTRTKDDDNMLLWREPQNPDGTSSGPAIEGELNTTGALAGIQYAITSADGDAAHTSVAVAYWELR